MSGSCNTCMKILEEGCDNMYSKNPRQLEYFELVCSTPINVNK